MIDPVLWHKAVSRLVLSALRHLVGAMEEAGVFAPFLPTSGNVRASGQSCRERKQHTRN